jgi:hypothetical protein
MNERFKSTLKYTGVFLLGFLVGAFLLETLEIYLRPTYRDRVIRSYLKAEQEFSASRAIREKRPLDAAFHRWAVVNAEADNGFRVLRAHDNDIDSQPYSYPLGILGLKWMSAGDNIKRGAKIVEGFDRGKLAAALDVLGRTKEAEKQWQLAQDLIHSKTIKETKEAVYSMLEQEKSGIFLKAEDKILGPQNK